MPITKIVNSVNEAVKAVKQFPKDLNTVKENKRYKKMAKELEKIKPGSEPKELLK